MNTVNLSLEEKLEELFEFTEYHVGETISELEVIAGSCVIRNSDFKGLIKSILTAVEQHSQSEQGYSEQYKGWIALFKDEKNYLYFLKWQREGYSEAEVKELLRQQREKCARAYLDNFKNHGILNAPEPQLKSSVT
jgi:hypothetical protein